MEYLLIFVLAVWIWRLSRRIDALTQKLHARAPQMIMAPPPVAEDQDVLVLDNPLPNAANDADMAEPPVWPWVYGAGLGAAYAGFGLAFADDRLALALLLLAGAALLGAAPALRPDWRAAVGHGPSIAIAVAAVLLVWTWPAAAARAPAALIGPALAQLLVLGLASWSLRTRWGHPGAFAAAAGAVAVGAANYLRVQNAFSETESGAPIWLLGLVTMVAAAALLANANRHHRAAIAAAGGASSAALIALFAASAAIWPTPLAATTTLLGAALLAGAAWRASSECAEPARDGSVAAWAISACALVLVALYALTSANIMPAALAALALAFVAAWRALPWRALQLAAAAAATLALAHAMLDDSSMAALFVAAALLGGAWVLTRALSTLFAQSVRAAAVGMSLIAAIAFVISVQSALLLREGLVALTLIAAGLVLGWRIKSDAGAIDRGIGPALAGAGLIVALFQGGLELNPWWGGAPAMVKGPPLLDTLAVALAAPALLAFIAAARWRAQAPAVSLACLGAGGLLLALFVILEIRRGFHGAEMSTAPLAPGEIAAYTLALALAFAVLRTRAQREAIALAMERMLASFYAPPSRAA